MDKAAKLVLLIIEVVEAETHTRAARSDGRSTVRIYNPTFSGIWWRVENVSVRFSLKISEVGTVILHATSSRRQREGDAACRQPPAPVARSAA